MNRWETEPTTRINYADLGRLLDTMTPVQEQAITSRVRLSDVEAAQAEESERENAVTTPMPRKSDELARIETPMLALGSGGAIAIPAQSNSSIGHEPARKANSVAVSVSVAAIVLVAFFAVYLCI